MKHLLVAVAVFFVGTGILLAQAPTAPAQAPAAPAVQQQAPAAPAAPATPAAPAVQQQAPAAPATPAAPAMKAPAAKPAKSTIDMVRGEVVSVDATANTITIKTKSGKSDTLNVDEKTKIEKAKKEIALSEVSAGDKVMIAFKVVDSKKIVKTIKISSKSGAKKAAAPATPAAPVAPAAPAK